MKILCLPGKDEKAKLSAGVFSEQIDKNPVYEVSVYYLSAEGEFKIEKNSFSTFYVLEGSVSVDLLDSNGKTIETRTLKAGRGWLLLPNQSQVVKAEVESRLFVIQNSSPLQQQEVTERGKKVVLRGDVFNELSDYNVEKPWGAEQWFVDTDIYVLKGIKMKSGFECSLHMHEQKIEVNLLITGKAQLVLGQNEGVNAAIARHHANGGNQADFSMQSLEVETVRNNIKPVIVGPGEGWKAKIYDIHQVLSLDTYYALEVSTPEVDDIIRLKDLYNRPGGRIESEHGNIKPTHDEIQSLHPGSR